VAYGELLASLERSSGNAISCLTMNKILALRDAYVRNQGKPLSNDAAETAIRNCSSEVYFTPSISTQMLQQCCFGNNKMPLRALTPMQHILNKAWPTRSSIRNFAEIVCNYVQHHADVCEVLRTMLLAMLSGAYTSCTPSMRPTFTATVQAYTAFKRTPVFAHHMAAWISAKNQHVLFLAIKLFIRTTISNIPALHSTLCKLCDWTQFSNTVDRQVAALIAHVNANAAAGNKIFDGMHDRKVSKHLRPYSVNIEHSIDYKSFAFGLFTNIADKLKEEWIKKRSDADDIILPRRVPIFINSLAWFIRRSSRPTIASVTSLLQKITRDDRPVLKALSGIAVETPGPASHRLCMDKFNDIFHFEDWSPSSIVAFHELCMAAAVACSITLVHLPAHITARQAVSLRRRLHRTELVEGNDAMFICCVCRQVRAFVIDVDSDGSSDYAWAAGTNKSLIDDEMTEQPMLFCGRRYDNSLMSRAKTSVCPKVLHKAQQTHMCQKTPLMRFDLLGSAVEFFGNFYLLCPSCARPMRLTPERYSMGRLQCIQCLYGVTTWRGLPCVYKKSSAIPCFHCAGIVATQTCLQYTLTSGQSITLCRRCRRRWMGSVTLDEHNLHLGIDEQWSVVRAQARAATLCPG
jgi:hypothetical protein